MFNFFKRTPGVPDINATEFENIRNLHPDHVIIDVRTEGEYRSGFIEDAIHLNIQSSSFSKKISTMDKEKHYLLYCRSGRRSKLAGRIMQAQGFKNVYNLAGGIIKWPNGVVQ